MGASARTHGSVGELAERATQYLTRGASQAREMVRGREAGAVVAAFVAGLSVGTLVGGALAAALRQPEHAKYRRMARGLGRHLLDGIETMLPAVVSEHLAR